jgi:hypothetical protein
MGRARGLDSDLAGSFWRTVVRQRARVDHERPDVLAIERLLAGSGCPIDLLLYFVITSIEPARAGPVFRYASARARR